LCYLWFVGHESASYRDVADRFDITISTLYHIITRVTEFVFGIWYYKISNFSRKRRNIYLFFSRKRIS